MHEAADAVAAHHVVAVPALVLEEAERAELVADEVIVDGQQGLGIRRAVLEQALLVVDQVRVVGDDVEILTARVAQQLLPALRTVALAVDAVVRSAVDGDVDGFALAVGREVADIDEALVGQRDGVVSGLERDGGLGVHRFLLKGVDEQADRGGGLPVDADAERLALAAEDARGVLEAVVVARFVLLSQSCDVLEGSRGDLHFSGRRLGDGWLLRAEARGEGSDSECHGTEQSDGVHNRVVFVCCLGCVGKGLGRLPNPHAIGRPSSERLKVG